MIHLTGTGYGPEHDEYDHELTDANIRQIDFVDQNGHWLRKVQTDTVHRDGILTFWKSNMTVKEKKVYIVFVLIVNNI